VGIGADVRKLTTVTRTIKWGLCFVVAAGIVLHSGRSAAQEEEGEKDIYAGADISFASLSAKGETFSPITLRGRLGLVVLPDLEPTLSVEAHFGFDVTDDTSKINGNDVTLRLNNYVAAYGRASQQVLEKMSVYGLLGFSAVQLQGNTEAIGDDTATGLSFGVGAMLGLPYDIDGYVEVMQLVNGDAFDIYTFSIGVSYKL
jgi:hypothetical protein